MKRKNVIEDEEDEYKESDTEAEDDIQPQPVSGAAFRRVATSAMVDDQDLEECVNDFKASCHACKVSPESQPPELCSGVKMRDYQVAGLQWLHRQYQQGTGGILGDEMGLGKTLQTISFLVHLKYTVHAKGRFLVVVPLSLIQNWLDELVKFAGDKLEVLAYYGDREQRTKIEERMDQTNFDVVVTTFETFLNNVTVFTNINWKVLAVDEAHRLKNSNSVIHTTLTQTIKTPFRYLMTGTPIQNNVTELGALLHFACGNIFRQPGAGGVPEWFEERKAISGNQKALEELTELIQPFILRRNKDDVVELPPLKEIILYTPLSNIQQNLYRSILLKDVSAFELGKRTSLINILINLRKCVDHPYMFDGIEPEPFQAGEHLIEASGKLRVLDKVLKRLKAEDRRVLIFSQMTHMLDILQDYLAYRDYAYERLDGSVRSEERILALKSFNRANVANADANAFVFLLSTRAGGVGLNLTTADTVIFVDSDFNPMMDQQAAARAHRIGQTKPVTVIRLITPGTVDEMILMRAREKLKLATQLMKGVDAMHDHDLKSKSANDIVSIIQFGLHKFVGDDEVSSAETSQDIDQAVDEVVEKWIESESNDTMQVESIDIDNEENTGMQDVENLETAVSSLTDMYTYAGTNYRRPSHRHRQRDDEDALAELKQMSVDSKKSGSGSGVTKRQPSQYQHQKFTTEEEEEELRLARLEVLQQRKEERARKKEEKRKEMWARNGYESWSVVADDVVEEEQFAGDGEGEGEEEEERTEVDSEDAIKAKWHLKKGSVTEPELANGEVGIIIHVCDNSGMWPDRGVFAAINRMDEAIGRYYSKAAEMDDLHLGDAHIVPVTPSELEDPEFSRANLKFVALIVAQKRVRADAAPSGVRFPDLEAGLKKVAYKAKELGASVHLPRIGQNTPQFDWYQTERIIRKCLPGHGVKTVLYYYPRSMSSATSRRQSHGTGSSTMTVKGNGGDTTTMMKTPGNNVNRQHHHQQHSSANNSNGGGSSSLKRAQTLTHHTHYEGSSSKKQQQHENQALKTPTAASGRMAFPTAKTFYGDEVSAATNSTTSSPLSFYSTPSSLPTTTSRIDRSIIEDEDKSPQLLKRAATSIGGSGGVRLAAEKILKQRRKDNESSPSTATTSANTTSNATKSPSSSSSFFSNNNNNNKQFQIMKEQQQQQQQQQQEKQKRRLLIEQEHYEFAQRHGLSREDMLKDTLAGEIVDINLIRDESEKKRASRAVIILGGQLLLAESTLTTATIQLNTYNHNYNNNNNSSSTAKSLECLHSQLK